MCLMPLTWLPHISSSNPRNRLVQYLLMPNIMSSSHLEQSSGPKLLSELLNIDSNIIILLLNEYFKSLLDILNNQKK